MASATFPKASQGGWTTVIGTYDFPGYTVVDANDYLEIDYYGDVVSQGPTGTYGDTQIRVDDNTLPAGEQTRIEG